LANILRPTFETLRALISGHYAGVSKTYPFGNGSNRPKAQLLVIGHTDKAARIVQSHSAKRRLMLF